MQTIFALCSGHIKSGVAVFRISGPEATRVLRDLSKKDPEKFPPRQMVFAKIYDPKTTNPIDETMIVYFSRGSSFTGEEVAEIHAHGSLAVIKLLSSALTRLDYIRLAEPGEFARRAFLNGKMDLTSAEGLADLIEAETELQHAQAIRQLGGGLEKMYESWRAELLKILSLLEAYIDFPDEEIPERVLSDTNRLVHDLSIKINDHLDDNNRGERLRSGLKLAIFGAPNVGKSSLLNLLMRRDVAIVSEIAGTTRDVLEGHLDIGGYPVILQDTAGMRSDVDDIIEQEGIERARLTASNADIKLLVFDATRPETCEGYTIDDSMIVVANKVDLVEGGTSHSEEGSIRRHSEEDEVRRRDPLYGLRRSLCSLAMTRSDVGIHHRHPEEDEVRRRDPDIGAADEKNLLNCNGRPHLPRNDGFIPISTKTEQGLDELLSAITDKCAAVARPTESPAITRARHRVQLEKAALALRQFSLHGDLVLAAEDVRMTVRYLSNITGKITVDEILGEIFSNFCIGK